MTRVFVSEPLQAGSTIELRAGAARHLLQVLKLRVGESVVAFDGSGVEASAIVAATGRERISLTFCELSEPQRESPLRVRLGLCVSKSERMDLALQKSVELGVHSIVPLSSERSVVRLDEERWQRKHQHWQGIVISACEQSGRVRVPLLAAQSSLRAWCASERGGADAFVCSPESGQGWRELPRPADEVWVLIGPEGGLSPAEVDWACDHGFRRVRMGPRTLRAETASFACLAAIQTLWGDLG